MKNTEYLIISCVLNFGGIWALKVYRVIISQLPTKKNSQPSSEISFGGMCFTIYIFFIYHMALSRSRFLDMSTKVTTA